MYQINKKGETLIEVITALTSLVIAGVASVTIIIAVMQTNSVSKEYLIAQNLAREGIEGVISIRDTNWLTYPSNKTANWLCLKPNPAGCAASVDVTKKYILTRDSLTTGFYLVEKAGATGREDAFKLSLKSETVGSDTIKVYSHTGTVDTTPIFYRMITSSSIDASTYKVTATVQWLNKSTVQTYALTSIITNYAK